MNLKNNFTCFHVVFGLVYRFSLLQTIINNKFIYKKCFAKDRIKYFKNATYLGGFYIPAEDNYRIKSWCLSQLTERTLLV